MTALRILAAAILAGAIMGFIWIGLSIDTPDHGCPASTGDCAR